MMAQRRSIVDLLLENPHFAIHVVVMKEFDMEMCQDIIFTSKYKQIN